MPRSFECDKFSHRYIVGALESPVVSVSWQFMQSAMPVCRP